MIVGDNDPRSQFQVSADAANATAAPIEFGNVNATYPAAFARFSTLRLFSALNNNVNDVRFYEAGTFTPATVSGFGAVFTDVDVAGATKIDFFDAAGDMLSSREVLATPGNESLSFLGSRLPSARLRECASGQGKRRSVRTT